MYKIFDVILNNIFPPKCLLCNKISHNGYVCDNCAKNIQPLKVIDACKRCGLPKSKCDCNKINQIYINCYAPYLYKNEIKQIIHKGKISNNIHAFDWLAVQLADYLTTQNLPKIDLVVSVPMSSARLKEKKYNQADYLAKKVSNILKLPYNGVAISKIKDNLIQHTLNKAERAKNVIDVYCANEQAVNGKTILLIDDIKTTGHTANECARALLKAGAKFVYVGVCAVVEA